MFKSLAIALVLTTIATTSSAFSNGHQGCGPEASVGVDLMDQDNRGQNDFKISFDLKWTFGAKEACAKNNAHTTDINVRDIRQAAAAERKLVADAMEKEAKTVQAEIKGLADKIKLCSDFSLDTAPASIKAFCGDLLM